MQITGTHFNYYLICHRKLWLFANGINMESTSDLVTEGKLLHEHSYSQRSERFQEVEIEGIKIDYFDKANNCIHELKKSDKLEEAHVLQLKYYLYILESKGVTGVSGLLEYPKLRKTMEIYLTDADRKLMHEYQEHIMQIINRKTAPERRKKSICRKCSYYDFCYAEEPEQ